MLTITDWTYIFSKDNDPVAHAAPGDVVRFVTRDCFNRQVKEGGDIELTVDFDQCNPATGPLYVDGAEPGDALAVDILDIQVADHGVVASIPDEGPLAHTCTPRVKVLDVVDGLVRFNDVSWPINPMIGVIGTAPAGEGVPTGHSFDCGGNMDSQVITKGVTVWLPVRVPGALLAMGDLHATMGDGEVSATGVEIDGEVIVRVRLVKGFSLNWPVTETADAWFVNTNGPTCDEAVSRGYHELQRLLQEAYGWDATDTCMYMSLQGYLCANQACLEPEAGGNTFRVGTPKLASKPRLIG